MNTDLKKLQPYPFEKLAALKHGITPPADRSAMTLAIGEPKHPTPDLIKQALTHNLTDLSRYPLTRGSDALCQTIADWLTRRFQLPAQSLDPLSQILPVNGTREALFAFAQAVVERNNAKNLVLMPNPFYQIYEGAALLAGAEPWFINASQASDWLPDFAQVPDEVWARCQLLYICTPNNPSGSVMSVTALQDLIRKADAFDFVIASDECYSEIYGDEQRPPTGLLQAAAAMGRTDYHRCVVFHSLSKRSSAPGLRSGFVAGDAAILKAFLLYRTYHGCAISLPVQAASIAAWNDETHVRDSRAQYREKFAMATETLASCLPCAWPEASFYLWAQTPISDEIFARELFAREHVTVLPGSYLSRTAHGVNPGENRVRIALVPELAECTEAIRRIKRFAETL